MHTASTKSKKAIFSTKVKFKVTRSLTLVSFERASLVEYACQTSTSNSSKVIANVKVDNRQTNRQTDKQTNRQDKNNMPPIIRCRGIIKMGNLLFKNLPLILGKQDVFDVIAPSQGPRCAIRKFALERAFLNKKIKTKRRRSDPVLWQKPLHQQKCQKGKVTTQTTPQKVRLNSNYGPT